MNAKQAKKLRKWIREKYPSLPDVLYVQNGKTRQLRNLCKRGLYQNHKAIYKVMKKEGLL